MEFEEYVNCTRSSLKAPKVFLDRKPKEMRINVYWKNSSSMDGKS